MRKLIPAFILGAVAGFAAAALLPAPSPVSAGGANANDLAGAGNGGFVEEKQRWTNVTGNTQSATWQRTVLKVSAEYGELYSIGADTLWYKDKEGIFRNVTFHGLVRVESQK